MVFYGLFLFFGAVSFLFLGSLIDGIQPGMIFFTGMPEASAMSRLTVFFLFILALTYACTDAMVRWIFGPSHRRSRLSGGKPEYMDGNRESTSRDEIRAAPGSGRRRRGKGSETSTLPETNRRKEQSRKRRSDEPGRKKRSPR